MAYPAPQQLKSDVLPLVLSATAEAGTAIMSYFRSPSLTVGQKAPNDPVTSADLASNQILADRLARFSWPMVSEENPSSPPLRSPIYWLIDPLDGTRDFINQTAEFVVMVALMADRDPLLSVIYHPPAAVHYWAIADLGAFCQTSSSVIPLAVRPAQTRAPIFVVSRTRPSPLVARLKHYFPAYSLTAIGSAGLKGALIAQGQADALIYPVSTMHEWDIAPAALLVAEAGGKVSDCLGQPLRFGRPSFSLPKGVLMANALLFSHLLPLSRSQFSLYSEVNE